MLTDRLYLITDRKAVPDLPQAIRQAIAGGVRLVQLREKDLDDAQLIAIGHTLRTVCSDGGARLVVNRNLDVALEIGADGLHIGYYELERIPEIRQKTKSDFLIGVSTHAVAEAERAQAAGADFVTLGPVYFTPSKAGMGEPLGPAEVGRGARRLSIPVFGLGGVSLDKLGEMRDHGITRASMIRAVLAAIDPAQAAQGFLSELRR